MKTLLILEGIAASGKTTTATLLKQQLEKSHRVRVFNEEETLMDIVDDRRFETALEKMNGLLKEFSRSDADVLITDRFHVTHAFRTEKELSEIAIIEDAILKNYIPHIFLLTVDEDQIGSRVQDSWNRRGTWLGTPGTLEEKVTYYKSQQVRINQLAKESKIPVTQINTTAMDWENIASTILSDSGLK